jgi:hypothetical protein
MPEGQTQISATAAGATQTGGTETTPAPWYSEASKPLVEAKGWKTADEAIGAYTNLEKLIGADRAGRTIVKPKDDKDAEGIKAYRAALGVPDSPDKYELPAPSGDGGGDLAKAASQWFHEAGIPREAAHKVTAAWNAHIEALVKQGGMHTKRRPPKRLANSKANGAISSMRTKSTPSVMPKRPDGRQMKSNPFRMASALRGS